MQLKYTKHERIWLKTHAALNEKWLQDRIAEDPSILGLGELNLLDRERIQERAGRLDLLLSDPEQNQRYEVEIMLGATDEAHIIRCIEYWDIERRRYPGYDHTAVIVAEDITSRFLNVLALFSGSIPIIAIQLSAIQIGEHVLLHFAKVLDQQNLRVDDEDPALAQPVDRSYWENRASKGSVQLADQVLELINATSQGQYALNYNKHYIGLFDGTRARNFMVLSPRKKYIRVVIHFADPEPLMGRCDEAGLSAEKHRKGMIVVLSAGDLKKHEELLRELIGQAAKEHEG
ncbi:MAG: hypothetical protein R3C29_17775 [Dehalococcoidia bacterium]